MAARKKNSVDGDTEVVKTPAKSKSAAGGSSKTKTETFAKEKTMSEGTIIDLDMNLEDYEDFENLPAGEYPGECVVAEVRTSDRGNQYFYTNWKIAPEDFPADYDIANAPEGMTLNYSRISVPDASNRRSITNAKKFIQKLGLTLKTSQINPQDWIGKKAKLVVQVENYNGEDRNSVRAVESLDD